MLLLHFTFSVLHFTFLPTKPFVRTRNHIGQKFRRLVKIKLIRLNHKQHLVVLHRGGVFDGGPDYGA